jgi:hypothetical protein
MSRWLFFPTQSSASDWDTVPRAGLYAANTSHTQGTGITYTETTGVFDSYRQTGTAMEPVELNWASADNLSVDMSETVNTNTCASALPYCAYWNPTSQKWRKGVASARGAFKTDMIYTGMSDLGFSIMDDVPCAFIIFTSDPGNVSGWRDYDGQTDYLQEITWTMSDNGQGSGAAVVSSTGQSIVYASQTTFLMASAGAPRFKNGTVALSYGATGDNRFATGAACRAWWDNYNVAGEKNGGGFVSLGNPVGGATQTHYINLNNSNMPGWGTAAVSGDVFKFRISTAT